MKAQKQPEGAGNRYHSQIGWVGTGLWETVEPPSLETEVRKAVQVSPSPSSDAGLEAQLSLLPQHIPRSSQLPFYPQQIIIFNTRKKNKSDFSSQTNRQINELTVASEIWLTWTGTYCQAMVRSPKAEGKQARTKINALATNSINNSR